MSIHREHPFATAEVDRSPLRRLRGRMPSPVSVWTGGTGRARAGWTLSSFLVADGEPAQVIGVLDEDSDLATALIANQEPARFVVNLLGWSHRNLADVFAGMAPAPGGAFKLGTWLDTDWGPALADAPGWLGARLVGPVDHAGWGLLVRGEVEHVALGPTPPDGVLCHVHGRYRAVPE